MQVSVSPQEYGSQMPLRVRLPPSGLKCGKGLFFSASSMRLEKIRVYSYSVKKKILTKMGEKIRFSHFRVDQPFQNPKNKVMGRLDMDNLD